MTKKMDNVFLYKCYTLVNYIGKELEMLNEIIDISQSLTLIYLLIEIYKLKSGDEKKFSKTELVIAILGVVVAVVGVVLAILNNLV